MLRLITVSKLSLVVQWAAICASKNQHTAEIYLLRSSDYFVDPLRVHSYRPLLDRQRKAEAYRFVGMGYIAAVPADVSVLQASTAATR